MTDCRCGHPQADHPDNGECRFQFCACFGYRVKRVRAPFMAGVRLNKSYCLVRLTYFQAQQLFLAADPQRDDDGKAFGWKDIERKALREALDKLRETAVHWPQGMDL